MGIEAVDTGAVETFASEGFYDDIQKVQWGGREVQNTVNSYSSKNIHQKAHATIAQHTTHSNVKTTKTAQILGHKEVK